MPGSKTYHVYIMASKKNGTLYIGVTSNLIQRVTRHKKADAPGFTQRYRIHRLVHYETFANPTDAILREKRLKAWKRPWKIRLIEETNPQWHDLYANLLA
jgi:putative endonuclease